MEDGTPLDDILNSEPTTEVEQPSAEQSGQPRDEHGRFASLSGDEHPEPVEAPTEDAAPPAAPQEAEPGYIPVAALRDERQKRQQLEERLQQFEAYYAQQQQPQQYQPQIDPETDPLGWMTEQVRSQVLQEAAQIAEQVRLQTRAEASELFARQQHEDYDNIVSGPLIEAVQANPFLVQRIASAPNPAMEGYQIGKQWAAARDYGSNQPQSRDQMRAELLAELKAELGLSNTPKAPTSLASERSVGSRSGPAWSGPTPIGDILSR